MRYFFSLLLLASSFFWACNNTPSTTTPLVVTMTEAKAKKCVVDTVCAQIELAYPVLSGGDKPAVVQSINDTIMAFVYMVIGGDQKMPLPQAFDSAIANLYLMVQDQYAATPEMGMSFANELTSKNLFQSKKALSIEMSNYSFTGGAHGNYGSALFSFSLADGKLVELTDIVKDTVALQALIQKGFVDTHNKNGDHYTLEDLVFPESIPLPLPMQWCVVKEGVRFVYNPYEVAPYAVGQTDIILTWEQLGVLADRNKWMD
ncbi:MAG: DUF3298 and DUF4163 domain-containing protein [Saprospiraceae bacterium]|nr:DUF3298 and DUF4163 domain-containing protein [Saprospiraceae bacterium]